MSLVAEKGSGSDFEIVPAGVYVARCYRIIDLGTQETIFANEAKKQKKVLISWEVLSLPGGAEPPKVTIERDGQKSEEPFSVHKRYTVSLHPQSNLRPDLESWRGKPFTDEELMGFDLKKVLGVYCQVQVVHEAKGDKTYANVNTLMQTTEKPKKINDDVLFDLDQPDNDVYQSLSDNIKETIAKSPEWQEHIKGTAPEPNDSKEEVSVEDIPF